MKKYEKPELINESMELKDIILVSDSEGFTFKPGGIAQGVLSEFFN